MKMQFGINGTIIRLSSMLIATTFFFTSCSSFIDKQNMCNDDEKPPANKEQTCKERLDAFKQELLASCKAGCLSCNGPFNSTHDQTGSIFPPCLHAYHERCLSNRQPLNCNSCNTCIIHSEKPIPLSNVFKNIKALDTGLNLEFLNNIPFCLWRLLICSVDSASFESFVISRDLTYKKIAQQLMWTKPGEYNDNIDNKAFVNLVIAALQGDYGFVPMNGFLSLCGKSFSSTLYRLFIPSKGMDWSWLNYETVRQYRIMFYSLTLIAQSPSVNLRLRDSIISILNDLIKELNSYQGVGNDRVKNYFNKYVNKLAKAKNFCETPAYDLEGFEQEHLSYFMGCLSLELLDRMQFKFSKEIILAKNLRLEELEASIISELEQLKFPLAKEPPYIPIKSEVRDFLNNKKLGMLIPDTTALSRDELAAYKLTLINFNSLTKKILALCKELEKLNNTYRKNHPPIYPQGPKQ